ncbi:hypothetical protein PG996_012321 [Apiospora saccharicola]|uniref:Uncharacterized protein n=1 Tax=Apiospora saccharicola TaxID=335842 RepID=A0ABR1U296_9PEZI
MDPNKDLFVYGPSGVHVRIPPRKIVAAYKRLLPEQVAVVLFCIVCLALEQRDKDRKVTPPEIHFSQYEHLGHYAPKAGVSARPVNRAGTSTTTGTTSTTARAFTTAWATGYVPTAGTANPAVNDFVPVVPPSSARDGPLFMTRRRAHPLPPLSPHPLPFHLPRLRSRSGSRSPSWPSETSADWDAYSSDGAESLD